MSERLVRKESGQQSFTAIQSTSPRTAGKHHASIAVEEPRPDVKTKASIAQRSEITACIIGFAKFTRKAAIELPDNAMRDGKNHRFFRKLFTPRPDRKVADSLQFSFADLPLELCNMIYKIYRGSDPAMLYSMVSVQLGVVRSLEHLPLSWTPDQQYQIQHYSDLKSLRYICWMDGRYLSTSGYSIAADNLPLASDITGLEVALDELGVRRLTVLLGQCKSVVFDGAGADTNLWHAHFPITKGAFVGLLGSSDVCTIRPSD